MFNYNFLILALLFLLPGGVFLVLRKDLRLVGLAMVPFALPFAVTEQFFYPEYWRPLFLFDLIHKIGFGLEDLLYLVGIALYTSTCYAFFLEKKLVRFASTSAALSSAALGSVIKRALLIILPVLIIVPLLIMLSVSVIYISFAVMFLCVVLMGVLRRDLIGPILAGGLISMLVYFFVCVIFTFIYPEAFTSIWHTSKFIGIFIYKVPIEELLYGFFVGLAGTAFYPYVFAVRFR